MGKRYSRKDAAKKSLLNCGFIENVDYHIEMEPTTTGISEKLNENIFSYFKSNGQIVEGIVVRTLDNNRLSTKIMNLEYDSKK